MTESMATVSSSAPLHSSTSSRCAPYLALLRRRRLEPQNLIDLEKGPLPKEVLEALDAAWATVKGHESLYFR